MSTDFSTVLVRQDQDPGSLKQSLAKISAVALAHLCRRPVVTGALTIPLLAALWIFPQSLEINGRLALIVTVLTVVGWTLTRIPDSLVAMTGAVFLVGLGVLEERDLYASLGSEMIWLLVAAFVMAAILKASGLLERLVLGAIDPLSSIRSLFFGLSLIIALTAFMVPSTSGRAAMLLPIFLTLADRLPDRRLLRPLALLFPTVILLSAGGSLIGAGAHFVAVDMIGTATGQSVGYFQWIALALPFALLSGLAGVLLIMVLFVPQDLMGARLILREKTGGPLTGQQKSIAFVVLGVIGAWMTIPLHGFDVALVAIAGAVVLLCKVFTVMKPKEVFRHVEVELLIFLASTLVIARALQETGADKWLAQGAMNIWPVSLTGSFPFVAAVTALVALTAHLVINSRSARAAVLLPVFALPIAGFGHDATLLILITVLGTGFCQTMMASAKPVALFGNLDQPTFRQADLFRLAVPLFPVMFALLMAFALFVWPNQITTAGTEAYRTASVQFAHPVIAAPELSAAAEEGEPSIEAPAMPGALCTRDELKTVIVAKIHDHRMWSAGWWHVWDRLRRDGFPVEREAVRSIYRGDNLVMLRSHSVDLAKVVQNIEAVRAAQAACSVSTAAALLKTVPVPRPKT